MTPIIVPSWPAADDAVRQLARGRTIVHAPARIGLPHVRVERTRDPYGYRVLEHDGVCVVRLIGTVHVEPLDPDVRRRRAYARERRERVRRERRRARSEPSRGT